MKIKNILKEKKCRVTKERLEIYDFMEKNHFFNAKDLQKQFPLIWRASVFRTLNLFLELWIIRRLNLWDKIESYELVEETHYHEHMKCQKCHKIISFDSENICKKIFEKAKEFGFQINEHSVGIFGKCRECLGNSE